MFWRWINDKNVYVVPYNQLKNGARYNTCIVLILFNMIATLYSRVLMTLHLIYTVVILLDVFHVTSYCAEFILSLTKDCPETNYHILSSIKIYIPGTLGPCCHYWWSVCGICKWSDIIWPAGRVHSFADYTISLSSLCRPTWRHWTTKVLVRYMLPSVCLRLKQLSQLSFILYMGLCVFSLPNSPVMIVRMCTSSYHHHQTGSTNH